MKLLMALGTFALLVFGLSCYENLTQNDDPTSDDWNTIRSDWVDTRTYASGSLEADAAYEELQNSSTGNTVVNIGHFQVALQSVETNADGTQTWTYAITKVADGRDFNDLSHFTMIFDSCDNASIVDMDGGSYGPDPSALSCSDNQDGLKWDRAVGAGETVLYSFTVDQGYGMGTATGLVKYGTSCQTASIPAPDCTSPVVVDDGTGTDEGNDDEGNNDGSAGDDCPAWIDTLTLNASVEYLDYHGLNAYNFPVYYVGETMHANLTICNNTPDAATGLTVKTIVEKYPNGGLACGDPVQTWQGVTIAPFDCLVLDHAYYLDRNCPWGNYESHLVITRDADSSCPVSALIMANGVVGYFDP